MKKNKVEIDDIIWMLYNMYKLAEEYNNRLSFVNTLLLKIKLTNMIINKTISKFEEDKQSLFLGQNYKEILMIITVNESNIDSVIDLLKNLKLSLTKESNG